MKNVIQTKVEKIETTDTEELSVEKTQTHYSELNTDKLIDVWKEFAESISKQMPRMHQVLVSHLPEKIDDFILLIKLDNTSQQKDFAEKIQARLSGFLIQKLELQQIEIKIEVVEELSTQNLIYTSQDKYNYLAEQNESIHTLRKIFNLDIE